MLPSAARAIRNEVARGLKPSKVTTFAELFGGTATNKAFTRTAASGCGRLAKGCDTSIEHPLDPHTRETLLRIREPDTLPSHAWKEMPERILPLSKMQKKSSQNLR